MHRYIGLDVHAQSCTAAVLGPSGRRLREQRLEINGQVIRDFVCGVAGQRHLCFEEGLHSDWLYELLEPVVDEIVVAIPETPRGAKSDSADAWARADELRRGAVARMVYKAPRRFTALRQAVRVHGMVQVDLVRSKNRWCALLRSRAIPVRGRAVYQRANRQQLIQQLPTSHRAATTVRPTRSTATSSSSPRRSRHASGHAASPRKRPRLNTATSPGLHCNAQPSLSANRPQPRVRQACIGAPLTAHLTGGFETLLTGLGADANAPEARAIRLVA